jgi:hypothetical protein
MLKIFAIATLSLVLCFNGLAQQTPADAPATQADVARYLEAMHSRELMSQTIAAMSKPMHQMVHDTYMKHKDNLPPDFEERMNKMMDDMLGNMPWDEMLQAMVPAYQKHLTKGDIDNLVAFYSSPTGQKLLREMPSLMADSMQATMPIMRKHIEGVTERIQHEMATMVKDSSTDPSAAKKN